MSLSAPLTFGELSVGDHFIGFPLDGDDSGHGGYRRAHNLFRKVSAEVRNAGGTADNAVSVRTNVSSHMPDSMHVIKIVA